MALVLSRRRTWPALLPGRASRRGGSNAQAALPRPQERVRQAVEDTLDLDRAEDGDASALVSYGPFTPPFDGGAVGRSLVYPRPVPPRGRVARYGFKQLRWLQLPARAKECVVRGVRKEVLFALGRVGFRGSSPGRRRPDGRRYRRVYTSSWRC